MFIVRPLTYAFAGRGTVSLPNGPFNARTPHSALCLSDGMAFSSKISTAAFHPLLGMSPEFARSLEFRARTIFPRF